MRSLSLRGADLRLLADASARVRALLVRGEAVFFFTSAIFVPPLHKGDDLLIVLKSEERSWVLLANHADQSLLRNHITMEFARSLSGIDFMPQSTSVSLYLNGKYQGDLPPLRADRG